MTPEDRREEHAAFGGEEEARELAAAAQRSLEADRDLAARLGRPESAGPPITARYLGELARRPALARGDERRLVEAAQAGDREARAALVEIYLPLIASVARNYRVSPQVERIELLQEGVVGLLRAVERFDPERGIPLWGYAVFWVRQAMQQLVAELTRPAVLSDRALRQLARVKDAHRAALAAGGREPSAAELAEAAGVPAEQVENLLAADRAARSLDEPLPSEDGATGRFGDLLEDPLAEDEYERVLDAIRADELLSLLAGLSERERAIVRARYGLEGDEESLREIGARLGLSAERVRQLEQRALGKLAASAGVDSG